MTRSPNGRKIEKLFIANRGEIAVRAARMCEKTGIKAVIPYAISDANSLATRMADENYKKGWELAPLNGTSSDETYNNPKVILDQALLHECDGIFLGYGFLSENADFIKSCEDAGILTLTPNSNAMRDTGNKISARNIAKKIKIGRISSIPILEGSPDLKTFEDAARAAKKLGYPVMMKDPDMGGGMGNVIVDNEQELKKAYSMLRTRRNNLSIFIERYIRRAAHVEVQIIADKHGNVVSLGERDCTMQRRNQKIIEESPSPNITEKMRYIIQFAAINFAKKIKYTGVGTWEFIVDLDRKGPSGLAWYFMEVNPRIQVEHGVTEEQTGIDIVETMLSIAEGKPLPFSQDDIKPTGHTIEARVYAENPDDGFKQSYGHLENIKYPQEEGLRIDKGAEKNDDISPWFDPTICKIIAHDSSRQGAINKLSRALLKLDIEGVSNNKNFLFDLINTNEFRDSNETTVFIENWWQEKIKKRIYGVEGIAKGGTYQSFKPTLQFNPSLLPQDISVPSRKSDELISYSHYYEEQKEKTHEDSAAEFGIVGRDGIQFVIYELDDRFAAGTLGIAEGIAFESACQLAYKKNLPLVTISRSGGARQQENSLALFQMGATINSLNRFPPLFHINIYSGGVYGGVPASFAGAAHLQIAVDVKQTKIGFSGPYITAKSLGKNPKSFSADESYKELPEGTHTPRQHLVSRNIDVLVGSLEDASDRITHLLHILDVASTITNDKIIFSLDEQIGLRELSEIIQPIGWLRLKVKSILKDFTIGDLLEKNSKSKSSKNEKLNYKQLTINEKREILMNPDRPSAADIMDRRSGVFDDTTSLTSLIQTNLTNNLPSVIAAIAEIDEKPVMVLGHQTQRVIDQTTGKLIKKYDPQKPADWDYAIRMIEFAKKIKLPIILFGDTLGADCLPESEDRNQSHKIAHVLKVLDEYPYPVVSINLGFKGSGGGETFIRTFDAAADFENALSFVSDPIVQYWILTGRWIDKNSEIEKQNELSQFVDKLKDSTAKERLEFHQIDMIIPEGKGGAHIDPTISAKHLREWIIKELSSLNTLPSGRLLERRHKRIEKVLNTVAVNKKTRLF